MNKQQGFSLIELMIVVTIIGIIGSIAIPSYNGYVLRTSRHDAMTGLLNLMRAQEDFFANDFTYTTTLVDINANNFAAFGAPSVANSFTIPGERYYIEATECAGGALINNCVLLTATPINEQATDGNINGEFTLNSRGERTFDNDAGWPE